MTTQDINDGKTLATICYLTFVGLIISIILNLEKKNPFVWYHTRQMLGLIILLIFSNVTEKYVNSWLGTGCWFITFGFWIISIYYAFSGLAKPIPVFGEMFQRWFANLGN